MIRAASIPVPERTLRILGVGALISAIGYLAWRGPWQVRPVSPPRAKKVRLAPTEEPEPPLDPPVTNSRL